MLYALLVVAACNHRQCYSDWFALAGSWNENTNVDDMVGSIMGVLKKDGWLASPKVYAVSAATAFRGKLPKGANTMHRLQLKVARFTVAIFERIRTTGVTTVLKELEKLYQYGLGILLVLILARYLGLKIIEVFTDKSAKYAPAGHTPESLGQAVQSMIAKSPVLSRVVERVFVRKPEARA